VLRSQPRLGQLPSNSLECLRRQLSAAAAAGDAMIGAAVPAAVPAAPAAAPAVSAAARADARALDGIELSAVEQLGASVLLAGGARLEESVAEAVAAAVVDGGADEDDDGAGELCGGKAPGGEIGGDRGR